MAGGMKLRFLDNSVQRLASGKKLPIKPLEAVILYGTAAQRVKVVKKLVSSAGNLAQHKLTYHLVVTVCEACDNTVRAEMLFAMRRKLLDLSRSRFGNVVVQKLLDTVPAIQKKEMALELVDEALDLSRHMFGNHVVQKMLQHGPCQEVLSEVMTGVVIGHLATHPIAQHVVAKLIEVQPESTVEALLEDEENMSQLLMMKESAVLTAILKIPRVDDDVKETVSSQLRDKLEEFLEEGKQHFAIAAAISEGTPEQRNLWFEALQPHVETMIAAKGHASIIAEMMKVADKAQRKALLATLTKSADTLADVASNPYTTMTLRALIQSSCSDIPKTAMAALIKKSAEIATNSAAAVVLQQLLLFADDETKAALCSKLLPAVDTLMLDVAGAHVVQAMLENADEANKGKVITAVLEKILEASIHQQGTHVVQKALGVASDEQIGAAAAALEGQDLRESAIDCHACYTVQALLRETKSRQLDTARRLVMNSLKPHVFRLSVSPWAGHIVLDAMFLVGSSELKTAIRDVIFLKCEAFLSEVPASKRARAQRLNDEDPDHEAADPSAELRDAPQEGADDQDDEDEQDDDEEEDKPKRKVRATEKKKKASE